MEATYTFGEYDLIQTCSACPEQYDVYLKNKRVGYMRLRHGRFRVDVKDADDVVVYSAYPRGDGLFDSEERMKYLADGVDAIEQYLSELPTEGRTAMWNDARIREGRYYQRGDGVIVGPAHGTGKRLDGKKVFRLHDLEYTEDGYLSATKFNLVRPVRVDTNYHQIEGM